MRWFCLGALPVQFYEKGRRCRVKKQPSRTSLLKHPIFANVSAKKALFLRIHSQNNDKKAVGREYTGAAFQRESRIAHGPAPDGEDDFAESPVRGEPRRDVAQRRRPGNAPGIGRGHRGQVETHLGEEQNHGARRSPAHSRYWLKTKAHHRPNPRCTSGGIGLVCVRVGEQDQRTPHGSKVGFSPFPAVVWGNGGPPRVFRRIQAYPEPPGIWLLSGSRKPPGRGTSQDGAVDGQLPVQGYPHVGACSKAGKAHPAAAGPGVSIGQ